MKEKNSGGGATDDGAAILRRDGLGRVKTPRNRREALLDEFEKSGLQGAQFAQMAGIKYQTFASWVQSRRHERGEYRRRNKKRQQAKPLCLVEAAAPPVEKADKVEAAREVSLLQVQLPGGAFALVASEHQGHILAGLLRSLQTSEARRPC
jgi:hypothetical protein